MKIEKNYLCRYTVPMMIFMLGKERLEMNPTNIISIEKIDDYERNIRSVLKVCLRIDTGKKKWILSNKREIKCKFELNKIGMDNSSDIVVSGKEKIWNLEFSMYFTDEDEAAYSDNVDVDLKSEDYFESENILEMYLFNAKLLKSSNKIFNTVFTKGLLQDFIGVILTDTKHKKVLMSKVENDKVYTELLMPAHKAYRSLIYLDQYYGLYKTGALIYYDADILYILNTNGKVTAKRPKEFSEVVFMAESHVDSQIPGNGMKIKEGEKKYYINIPDDNIVIKDYTEVNSEKFGTDIKLVTMDSTDIAGKKKKDKNKKKKKDILKSNEYIKYTKKDDNKYTDSIIKARMIENECVIYISGENMDINAFTPNKVYKIVFRDPSKQKRYGKNTYRLAYAYHFIEKESTDYMVSSHRIVLKKAAKQPK